MRAWLHTQALYLWRHAACHDSENTFTFKSTVSGEDRESLWLMVSFITSCFLLFILCELVCVYIRGVCVFTWRLHVFIRTSRLSDTAAAFMSLYAHLAVCVSVCIRRGSPAIKAQGPLHTFQHLQHHVHHDEMSIFLYKHAHSGEGARYYDDVILSSAVLTLTFCISREIKAWNWTLHR